MQLSLIAPGLISIGIQMHLTGENFAASPSWLPSITTQSASAAGGKRGVKPWTGADSRFHRPARSTRTGAAPGILPRD